jgi:quercetin dioxygenase-like cupin family protein
MPTSAFVRGAERAPETVGEGVRRQVLSHLDDLMVVRVEFREGAVGYAHAHPHRQVSYVVSGRFEVTVGDETTVLVAGDTFAAAADVVHGVKALSDGTLIDCFTPARADFLTVAT